MNLLVGKAVNEFFRIAKRARANAQTPTNVATLPAQMGWFGHKAPITNDVI